MRKVRIAVVVASAVTSLALTGAVAFAQAPEVGEGGGGGGGGVVYESETSYDFEDDYVEGELIRPDGELIGGQRHGKDSRLINIRSDFVPEMVQSVEDL